MGLGAILDWFSSTLLLLVKFSYPTYASFKAIKSEGDDDDTTWLIYWVVISVISFMEIYIVPFVQWVPLFMLARLVLYVWMQLPLCNGSLYIYKKIIEPFFNENKKYFEAVTIEDSADLKNTVADLKKGLKEVYSEIYNSI